MQWVKNVCRICGEINDIYHYILYNKESPTSLEANIKKCFHLLELFKEDYKPKQVCYSCVEKINEFSNFIDICYATNQKFESLYYGSQEWYHRHPTTYNNYALNDNKHQSVIVSNKQSIDNNVEVNLYKSTNTVLESFNVPNLNETEVLPFVAANEEFMQSSCGAYFPEQNSNKLLLEPNFTATVLRHSQNKNEMDTAESDELFNLVPYGAQVEHKSTVSCEYAESVSNNACNNLSPPNKINSFTNKVQPVKNIPASKTSNLISVEEVQKLISTEPLTAEAKTKQKKSYQCPHCERNFLRRGTLNAHISVHTNITPYNCNKCSKSFPVKFMLTAHEKMHTGQHKCRLCLKRFPVPSKLERHMRIHTNDRPFVCDYPNCFKTFSDKRNLEGHKSIHMTERNFSCDICKKTFKMKSKLHQHLKCHDSSVRFKCEVCSKEYKHRTNLIEHLKKHI